MPSLGQSHNSNISGKNLFWRYINKETIKGIRKVAYIIQNPQIRTIILKANYKSIHLAANITNLGFPDGSMIKNSPASAGDAVDTDLIPGSGRSFK